MCKLINCYSEWNLTNCEGIFERMFLAVDVIHSQFLFAKQSVSIFFYHEVDLME